MQEGRGRQRKAGEGQNKDNFADLLLLDEFDRHCNEGLEG